MNFSTLWHKLVILLILFSTLRQDCNSTLKIFGTVRQNCSASLNFSDTVGQKCYSPHNFFDSVGETANWTLEKFGTVRRNCYSLPKNWYKTVIHLWNFSTRWDTLVIQRSKRSALWDKKCFSPHTSFDNETIF